VALAWLLRKPTVTSVIFGARTIEQLEDNLGATELRLDDGQLAALDEASAFELGYPYDMMGRIQSRW
jgi:aryl-alcohol dehydrogenase-like predicted oxidoreductase